MVLPATASTEPPPLITLVTVCVPEKSNLSVPLSKIEPAKLPFVVPSPSCNTVLPSMMVAPV